MDATLSTAPPAAGVATRRPLVVAAFTNEEGARFQPDMMGSLVYAGGIRNGGDVAKALAKSVAHRGDSGAGAIVTATNAFVTGDIARDFGIPHLIATIPGCKDGQFTGKPVGTPSFQRGKITRVDAWLESLGLWQGSFAERWFYSDSHNDLPLLEWSTRPVAVDADDTLTTKANNAGWPIISLRDNTPVTDIFKKIGLAG
mgnify:CR=1 FL=1